VTSALSSGIESDRSTDQACHELLLRLAGRLPDELMWRLRDWLAAGSRITVSTTLPRELLRHRVGLTDQECELLATAVGEWGASRRLLDAVLPVDVPDEPLTDFHPPSGDTDLVELVELSLVAVVRGHPGSRELLQTRRSAVVPAGNRAARSDQRVVLVCGGERPWLLTGTLQRLLRAHGDRTPCVEVLPPLGEQTEYHRAAVANAAVLWRGPTGPSFGA
jgi:hypothetical protein